MAFATLCTSGSAQEEPVPFTIGQEFTLSSTVLGEDRPILVSLPAGYDSTTATYPVLYLLDGRQNLMHVAGSVEVLSRTGQVPKMIIVGIPSLHRERDLTPSAMEGFEGSGGGARFLDFIARELMPYIRRTYRTHPYAVLEGHSLGGTLTAYALLHRPDLFDAYIIMSPALWWNHEELTAQARSALDDPRVEDKTIFFGIGDEDGRGMRQELNRFVAVLAQEAPPGTRWDHEEFEGEGHMSAPLLTNYFGLKMVFSDLQLPDSIRMSFTQKAFLAHESAMADKYGTAAAQTGESYVTLGLQLMKDQRYRDAVTVLQRDAEVYDSYPPSFRWLAEAQEKSGDLEAALKSYERALALSDENGQGDVDRANITRLKALLRGR
jgi:predicted alpha/beta superfamily hydrolase